MGVVIGYQAKLPGVAVQALIVLLNILKQLAGYADCFFPVPSSGIGPRELVDQDDLRLGVPERGDLLQVKQGDRQPDGLQQHIQPLLAAVGPVRTACGDLCAQCKLPEEGIVLPAQGLQPLQVLLELLQEPGALLPLRLLAKNAVISDFLL